MTQEKMLPQQLPKEDNDEGLANRKGEYRLKTNTKFH